MGTGRKYVVAVGLLVVLSVAFGMLGTVAPPLTEETGLEPQQESFSDSVGHFQNPPTYDSGWVDIRRSAGQYFALKHNLNTTEVTTYIMGKGIDRAVPTVNQTYGGGNNDRAFCVVQTSDKGFAVASETNSFGSGVQMYLVRTDDDGTITWNKTYGGTGSDYAYSVVETSDKGFAIAGETSSFGSGWQMYLVKTDALGNMIWNKTYGGAIIENARSVIQTTDGGYALAGYTNSYGAGIQDFWLVKTDASGITQWSKTYGGANGDLAYSMVETSDGGYAIAGHTYSYGAGGADFWLVKTDSAGTMQWNKTYGGTNDDLGYSAIQTVSGEYAVAGHTRSYDPSGDFWLVKTNASGALEWSKACGGTGTEYAYSVVQTLEGGYALAGYTVSYGAGGDDAWLVKWPMREHQRNFGTETGLAVIDLTNETITLYRGLADEYWEYVRIRMWIIKEPSWIYGDINMDGTVDAKDLYILGRNYGKSVSLLSLGGIIAIAGVRTYKKRRQAN